MGFTLDPCFESYLNSEFDYYGCFNSPEVQSCCDVEASHSQIAHSSSQEKNFQQVCKPFFFSNLWLVVRLETIRKICWPTSRILGLGGGGDGVEGEKLFGAKKIREGKF